MNGFITSNMHGTGLALSNIHRYKTCARASRTEENHQSNFFLSPFTLHLSLPYPPFLIFVIFTNAIGTYMQIFSPFTFHFSPF